MGTADAAILLRAVARIAGLAAREAEACAVHYARTSSLLGARAPPPAAPAAESDYAVPGRGQSAYPVPLALHPGPLDRKELLAPCRLVANEAARARSDQRQDDIAPCTADLSHLDLHVPPPPIAYGDNSRRMASLRMRDQEAFGADASAPLLAAAEASDARPALQESAMPANRVSRLFHYGSLAVGLGLGAIGEATRRLGSGGGSSGDSAPSSLLLSRANIDRIVGKLSKMRGAALKLGQMLSIQDSKGISPEIAEVLQRVQNGANYVPMSQIERAMRRELGADWRDGYTAFGEVPFAAASIGQVHDGRLSERLRSKYGVDRVAVKVQYPGIAGSIDSDLNNLQTLLVLSNLLPRGMYLENTIRAARKELHWECDYVREADAMARFGRLLADDPVFVVPRLVGDLSSAAVLTAEYMDGAHIKSPEHYTQEERDYIGTHVIRLCLRELFEFGFMQTDPNWANFLYRRDSRRLVLLDFGASRPFGSAFLDKYLRLLTAAMEGDREACQRWSTELGFLTGLEADVMTQAHVNSVLEIGKPFAAPGLYDFGNQDVSSNVRSAIPIMLRHRLTPPPEETYSLHRKLSGAYLLCIRLRARVPCQRLFQDALAKHAFADGAEHT
ncbi:hypothetical protein IWQ56_001331 [Coemansia nantahalensis]|nr:hypothetical protein IWQ56_001331 [Coemansia nantahalensis]